MKCYFPLLCCFLSIVVSAYGQTDKRGFLNELLKEKDYFRAITVLKELRYDSVHNLDFRQHCDYMIGYSYYRSAKYENAIDYLTLVAENSRGTSLLRSQARTLMALSYYGLRMYDYALMELDNAYVKDSTYTSIPFYKTLLNIERKQFNQTDTQLRLILQKEQHDSELAIKSKAILDLLDKRHTLPSKSPLLAGVLSCVVPGLGQIYSQHYFDGIQAMGFVTALGYATYASYKYAQNTNGSHLGTVIIGVVAGMFHVSNIVGAVKTAEFRNNRITDEYLNAMRNTYLSLDIALPLP